MAYNYYYHIFVCVCVCVSGGGGGGGGGGLGSILWIVRERANKLHFYLYPTYPAGSVPK